MKEAVDYTVEANLYRQLLRLDIEIGRDGESLMLVNAPGRIPGLLEDKLRNNKQRMLIFVEHRARLLRDAIYRHPSSVREDYCAKNNWEACKANWQKPEELHWLEITAKLPL